MDHLVDELIKGKLIAGKQVVFDATLVKAYNRRDPHYNIKGAFDPEARVDRNGKTYELGYKLHVAVDTKSELPLTVIAAPANDNEKKNAPILFEKALRSTNKRMNLLVADSQYSCQGQRTQASNSGVSRNFLSCKSYEKAKGTFEG